MIRRHDREELLNAAVDAVLESGLSELTFGRLAKRIGIPDRTIVYYFADKTVLTEAVLGVLAGRLLHELESAFGDARRAPKELLKVAYPLLTSGETDRIFAVWFEFAGQAAAKQEPQRQIANFMISGWIDWLSERVDVQPLSQARNEAIAMLALLDGALLLHHLGHRDAAAIAIEHATR